MKRLSILIPTLYSRADMFARLKKELDIQIIGKSVEIIYAVDGGEETTGSKRQRLLEMASGDYVVFIDDDDFIHPKYIELILNALEFNPHVVTFTLQYTTDMVNFKPCYFGLYDKDANYDDRFKRMPNHLCPVKRELALKTGFKGITFGEDADYARRLRPHLFNRKHIEEPLYTYWDRRK